ncbi:MAG: glycosyltransferase family 4 protein [Gemmataceae bacterium]|nr:glycosyltransferase family 4 protein [Gemmataceae bacterium]
MRLAVINWTSRKLGGTECYLDSVLPVLAENGHDIGFWCETDEPCAADRVRLGEGSRSWCAEADPDDAVRQLADWRPDLLYVHGLRNPALEERLQGLAPGIFFAHNYYGTCVSGYKALRFPVVRPCDRRFGLGCLACYLPRRCGGLNPWTMWTSYRLQAKRLLLLARYRMLITHSQHMQEEYRRHGLTAKCIAYYAAMQETNVADPPKTVPPPAWHLVFFGRFDPLKGGADLLKALPEVRSRVGIPLRLTMAGDGPCRRDWENLAARLRERHPSVTVDFPGWVTADARDDLLRRAHLLVVPSLWPEPFGRIGPEAGSAGLPVVAYDVGGVRDWLSDGENGVLASGNPPTVAGLTQALADALSALSDPARYRRMTEQARGLARRFTLWNHIRELDELFDRAVGAALAT